MTGQEQLLQEIMRLIGRETEFGPWGADAVNEAMIRHWCEALEDANPLYTDERFAALSEYGGIIAPPTMGQVFSRGPLWPAPPPEGELSMPFSGYESLVVRNNLEFFAPLRLGDRLRGKSRLTEISPRKTTRVGTGHFVTTTRINASQRGETASTWSLTVLRYPRGSPTKEGGPPPQRPSTPQAARAAPRARARGPSETLRWEEAQEGEALPPVTLPITVTRLVMLANATRDFYAVHHDREYARANGARDIFVNNAAYAGFFNRAVTDWAGPSAGLRKLDFSMQEMNFPGDVMTATGRVLKKHVSQEGEHLVDMALVISNQRGPTTTASATVALPSRGSR